MNEGVEELQLPKEVLEAVEQEVQQLEIQQWKEKPKEGEQERMHRQDIGQVEGFEEVQQEGYVLHIEEEQEQQEELKQQEDKQQEWEMQQEEEVQHEEEFQQGQEEVQHKAEESQQEEVQTKEQETDAQQHTEQEQQSEERQFEEEQQFEREQDFEDTLEQNYNNQVLNRLRGM